MLGTAMILRGSFGTAVAQKAVNGLTQENIDAAVASALR
jgi:hypothetical protein